MAGSPPFVEASARRLPGASARARRRSSRRCRPRQLRASSGCGRRASRDASSSSPARPRRRPSPRQPPRRPASAGLAVAVLGAGLLGPGFGFGVRFRAGFGSRPPSSKSGTWMRGARRRSASPAASRLGLAPLRGSASAPSRRAGRLLLPVAAAARAAARLLLRRRGLGAVGHASVASSCSSSGSASSRRPPRQPRPRTSASTSPSSSVSTVGLRLVRLRRLLGAARRPGRLLGLALERDRLGRRSRRRSSSVA